MPEWEPTSQGIERGLYGDTELTSASPALIYYVRIFGLQSGDVQELTVTGPEGNQLISDSDTLEGRSRAQDIRFVSLPRPDGGWAPGSYQGQYRLIRRDGVVIERSLTAVLQEAE